MALKELRLSKNLLIADVIKDFRIKRKVHGRNITTPIHFSSYFRYETGDRRMSPDMENALIKHIEGLQVKL